MEYKSMIFDKTKTPQVCLENLNKKQTSLKPGEVLIRTEYSGINYKDALGVLNVSPIFKTNPITPGIDFSGTVVESKSSQFKKGQKILANGMGYGEDKDGGYSEYIHAQDSYLVPLPKGLSTREAMILGTAGFTAALAIDRMLQNGQTFDKGPILVSGSTGGVGSFAIQILNQLGFIVEAVTSRKSLYQNYLESLGAHYVSDLSEVLKDTPPLAKAQWGGVIDNLGGEFLQTVLPQVNLWGNVASIGLAQGSSFKTTVMPFILRGVSLLGVSSNNCTLEKRFDIWKKLGNEWKPQVLEDLVSEEVNLEGLPQACQKLIDHKNHGRILVRF